MKANVIQLSTLTKVYILTKGLGHEKHMLHLSSIFD
jgi:hypothetical protein